MSFDLVSPEPLFSRELQELRDIGFAEALPLSEPTGAGSDVLRLECGGIGVAVEFGMGEDGRAVYRVVSLVPQERPDTHRTSSQWHEIMSVLRNRMPNVND